MTTEHYMRSANSNTALRAQHPSVPKSEEHSRFCLQSASLSDASVSRVFSADHILALQRSAGNHAVQRIINRSTALLRANEMGNVQANAHRGEGTTDQTMKAAPGAVSAHASHLTVARKPDGSDVPTMKKGTTPTDAVRLHAKMTYQPKGKPEVKQDYAPQATDLSAAIPHGTTGVLTLSVDGRYPPNLGEEYQSTWMVDASGEGLKITSLGTQHVNSTILSGDELTWSAQTAGTQIQVKLDATFEKWFQADDHFSGTVVLQLEQSFPDAKVTGPDEVTATYTVTGVIKPFPTNFATITQKALDDIRDFWTRLSPETQDAITRNELPGGDPVYLDGYASTKGRIRENFELGYDRAVAVMKILQKLSGNRADEKLFKTISHGEYDSPAATDAPAEEKDQAEFRAVVIRVTNSRTFTK